jgi:hypothetical protein
LLLLGICTALLQDVRPSRKPKLGILSDAMVLKRANFAASFQISRTRRNCHSCFRCVASSTSEMIKSITAAPKIAPHQTPGIKPAPSIIAARPHRVGQRIEHYGFFFSYARQFWYPIT